MNDYKNIGFRIQQNSSTNNKLALCNVQLNIGIILVSDIYFG